MTRSVPPHTANQREPAASARATEQLVGCLDLSMVSLRKGMCVEEERGPFLRREKGACLQTARPLIEEWAGRRLTVLKERGN